LTTATRVPGEAVWMAFSAAVMSAACPRFVAGFGLVPAFTVGPSSSLAPYSTDMIVG
jgi:hypothetical protein